MQQFNRLGSLLVALLVLFGGMTAPGDTIGLGITVTPGKFEASIPLGTTYNVPVTVANTTDASVHILASLSDFTLSDSGNYEFKKIGSSDYSLLRWGSIRPVRSSRRRRSRIFSRRGHSGSVRRFRSKRGGVGC